MARRWAIRSDRPFMTFLFVSSLHMWWLWWLLGDTLNRWTHFVRTGGTWEVMTEIGWHIKVREWTWSRSLQNCLSSKKTRKWSMTPKDDLHRCQYHNLWNLVNRVPKFGKRNSSSNQTPWIFQKMGPKHGAIFPAFLFGSGKSNCQLRVPLTHGKGHAFRDHCGVLLQGCGVHLVPQRLKSTLKQPF